MISCDLSHPDYNYEKVKSIIEHFGTWAHYLDSTTYVIKTPMTVKSIEDSICKYLTRTDRLIVCKVSDPDKWLSNKNIRWKK